jgi:hypothetical protein
MDLDTGSSGGREFPISSLKFWSRSSELERLRNVYNLYGKITLMRCGQVDLDSELDMYECENGSLLRRRVSKI